MHNKFRYYNGSTEYLYLGTGEDGSKCKQPCLLTKVKCWDKYLYTFAWKYRIIWPNTLFIVNISKLFINCMYNGSHNGWWLLCLCRQDTNHKGLHYMYIVKVQGTQTYSEASGRNYSTFSVKFRQTVEVTEYFYKELTYTDLLSQLGGTLGFWLGIGVMQILEYGFNFAALLFRVRK